MSLIFEAASFAELSHRGIKRKFTDADYIIHCGRVAIGVAVLEYSQHETIGDETKETLIAAAWLHDTIEDCGVSFERLEELFGKRVASLVLELTNVYTRQAFPSLNRAERLRKERERISKISYAAKIIKLVDRIDNVQDMPEIFYFKESNLLLDALRGTDSGLEAKLNEVIHQGICNYYARKH